MRGEHLAGNLIFGGLTAGVGQAGSLGKGALDFNQNYKNGFVQNVDGSKRSVQQYELKKALENKDFTRPISFGALSDSKLQKLNEIRSRTGAATFNNNDLVVSPQTVKHLHERRMISDGDTADEIVDVLYSALHNNDSRVFPTLKPNTQAIAKFNSDGQSANTAYLSDWQDTPGKMTPRSAYVKELEVINRQALDGGNIPSSKSERPSAPSAKISEPQSNVVNTDIIPPNQQKIKIKAAAPEPTIKIAADKTTPEFWSSKVKKAYPDISPEAQADIAKTLAYMSTGMKQGVSSNLQYDQTGYNVIGRTTTSNNAPWYQEFYRSKGRAPSQKEMMEIAVDAMKNGSESLGVRIDPADRSVAENYLKNGGEGSPPHAWGT